MVHQPQTKIFMGNGTNLLIITIIDASCNGDSRLTCGGGLHDKIYRKRDCALWKGKTII